MGLDYEISGKTLIVKVPHINSGLGDCRLVYDRAEGEVNCYGPKRPGHVPFSVTTGDMKRAMRLVSRFQVGNI